MNKKESLWISIPFLIIIFGFGAINAITPNRELSESENRTLKQTPSLKEDNFTGEFESYYADQFIYRDEFLKLYTKGQIFTEKTKVRDYYVHDNNWILENPEVSIAEEEISLAVDVINKYSQIMKDAGKEVYYISMPHKTSVLDHMYPSYIDTTIPKKNRENFISRLNKENINVLDLSNKFEEEFNEKELENLYFKTDHHWNSFGAFEGFKFIVDELNNKSNLNIEMDESEYKTTILDKKPFSGSYNLNLYQIISKDEEVPYVYKNKAKNYEIRKSYDGTWFAPTKPNEIIARFLDEKELTYAGAYAYDDHYYQIINKNALTDKKVLVIRDSYQSAMSWMLGDIFKEVEVVDPRHTAAVNLTSEEIINRSQADIVLFMYNDLTATKVIPELNK